MLDQCAERGCDDVGQLKISHCAHDDGRTVYCSVNFTLYSEKALFGHDFCGAVSTARLRKGATRPTVRFTGFSCV